MGAGKSLPSLEAARTIDAGQGTLQCVCFDRSGGRAASGGEDGSIKVWDTATGAIVFACLGHKGPVLCARYARVGDFLCSYGVHIIFHRLNMVEENLILFPIYYFF